MRLLDQRTIDGSRLFACFPRTTDWTKISEHAGRLARCSMPDSHVQTPAGDCCEFGYQQHLFAIAARDGLVRLFVRDPQCPDLILYQVGCHFERLLQPSPEESRRPSPTNTDVQRRTPTSEQVHPRDPRHLRMTQPFDHVSLFIRETARARW